MALSERPDVHFFVIGAARCGTTSLFRHLTNRRDVHLPTVKEPRFFSTNWDRGWRWFAHAIGVAENGMRVGDFSPNYSNSVGDNAAARRMYEFYPAARIVYLVRNPISCALSNWRMAAELSGSKPDFISAVRGRWACQLLHRCLFFKQISSYRRRFGDDQILVVPLEALRREPSVWLARIETHVGLVPSGANAFPRANASFRKQNRPKAPEVPETDRQDFCGLVRQDATEILGYAGLPEDFWSVGVKSSAWTPAD